MKNLIYILILLVCFGCEPFKTDNSTNRDSEKELLKIAKESNNFSLSILRDANKFILQVSEKNSELLNSNISRIDKLYKLNNSHYIQSSELINVLKNHNQTVEERYQIKVKSDSIDNSVDYYVYLDKLINNGNLSPGTVNEPRLLLPYAVNNSKFHSLKGDTIKVPIKTFRERDVIQWSYEVFDTLNFKKISDNEGYYQIPTSEMKLGLSTQKVKIYGRDLFTGKTEILGSENIEITLVKE